MYQLCGRTKPGGGKCGSPALKGKSFCYYHDPERLRRARAVKVRYFLELTMLEPGAAVHAAIGETVQALGRHQIDCEYGGRLLHALQLAWTGNQLGTSPQEQVSPRYIKIARAPGFTKIYTTARQPGTTPLVPSATAPTTRQGLLQLNPVPWTLRPKPSSADLLP